MRSSACVTLTRYCARHVLCWPAFPPWLHRLRGGLLRFVRRLHSFPKRTDTAFTVRPDARSPRFRRDPFARDVAFDPDGASAPCMAAPHILPSTTVTASAPATFGISWLNPTPHTIAVYASPWSSPSTAQHSLPGGRYSLPAPDFHRQDRASFSWRTSVTVTHWLGTGGPHSTRLSSIFKR